MGDEELSIDGLDTVKVKEIRENVPDILTSEGAPEELRKLDTSNPKAVLDMLVERAKNECGCKKHRTMSLAMTMFAVYLYDLLTDTGLELSDRQKSQLSVAFAEMAWGSHAFIGMVAGKNENAIKLAMAVLEDNGMEVAGVGGSVGGPLDGLLAMILGRVASQRMPSGDGPEVKIIDIPSMLVDRSRSEEESEEEEEEEESEESEDEESEESEDEEPTDQE
jgi:hypothetical protein